MKVKVPNIIIDIVRGILGIVIGIYSFIFLPSPPAFGWCSYVPAGYFVEEFVCSAWPMFFSGVFFVILSLIIGPKKIGYYFLVLFIFLFLSIIEYLRVGESIIIAMSSIPYQHFFHGGLVGLVFFIIAKHYLKKGNFEYGA